ncbi:hypothetical protein ABZP36_003664 [Zizania latifolia]
MPRRRVSISAGAAEAAVAARPLSPLALALGLALFSAMPHGARSAGSALPPLPPLATMDLTCDIIPSPFGLKGQSVPGFEVTCGPNKEAMLPIGEHNFTISYLSLADGLVVIFAGPIYQRCYDRSGRLLRNTGTGSMNLTGTPFFFSKRNKLVATGCNYRFFANFSGSLGGAGPTQTNCSPWCNGASNVIVNGSCLGQAYCQSDLPMDGAQEFNLTFEGNGPSGNVFGEEVSTCSAVFFHDQDDQIFTRGGRMPLKDALVPLGEHRMVLEWVIGRATCKQAKSNKFEQQYHCNHMSSCIDAPRGAGYLCSCNGGYAGNP